MHAPRLLPLLLATVLLPSLANAFSVPNHEALTRASIDAAVASDGLPELAAHRAIVVAGSRDEDLNLHVKWTGWNHFFHPGQTLDMAFRKDSSSRVRALWQEAEEAASHGDLTQAFGRVGHLVHHIQDMASPPHVVPVMHGLADRFEQRSIAPETLAHGPRIDIPPMSGDEAQLALAEETLNLVRTGALPVVDGNIPWSAFWAEPVHADPGVFGGYGEVGNAFGAARVRWNGRAWKVDPAVYEDFVNGRAEAAMAYSRAFLVWATERLTTLARERQQVMRAQWAPSPALALEVMGGALASPRGATPVAGARALLPLPWAMALSASYAQTLSAPLLSSGGSCWSLSVLSPPLWAARLGYAKGFDLRAMVGGGLSFLGGAPRPELPVGLRLHTQLGTRLSLSAEAQYRLFSSSLGPWANGISFTLGTGLTWGDT
ncbi:hypothetical protein D187_008676 [Cystobacter fuscus DSM 2262]|uniref:Phospholipase C/D domain-containing protein n=1 Tax=Cystobacter fuscus (strain ATCC 25194 / DSM 2262 / NBRC 100088 / M29) TaxID=1242864 RepID=S9R0P9_CYSF2|nr:hypothetical protein [Cystobacter fuscus]EPX62488.1 hypothetical protein D187_008676 [Cystobacter fuscus DSM 2262]